MRETTTVPAFPEIKDKLGYNPARFLDTSKSKRRNQIGETSPFATAEALIPGLNDTETIQGWITVEGELGRGENGGPRKDVIIQLYERRAQLEDTDDDRPSVSATEDDEHEAPSDTTGEPTPTAADASERETQPVAVPNPPTNADTVLAADGGEEPPSDPLCPVCAAPLAAEEVAGEVGYWCSPCGEFREPVTTGAHA